MTLEHEHVATPRRDHAGRWYRPRKAQPVRREIERWDDPAEDVKRSATAAVAARAAGRAAANHLARTFRHDAVEAGRYSAARTTYPPRRKPNPTGIFFSNRNAMFLLTAPTHTHEPIGAADSFTF